jgi:hypothetical protein
VAVTVRYVPIPEMGTVSAGTGTVSKFPTRGIPMPNPIGYRGTIGSCCGRRWGEAPGWWVWGSSGGGVVHSVARAGAGGLRPKTQNRATGAQLRVHSWEKLCGLMGGGGLVVGIR